MVTTFSHSTPPAADGNRYRVQGKLTPRGCAGTSVQANTSFATVLFLAITFFCAPFVTGCSRGPSYDEALQRYTAEQQELDRLNAAQKTNIETLTRIHQEIAATDRALTATGASEQAVADARAKLEAANKKAKAELVAEGDVLSKKISEQQKRVAEAEKLKNSLSP